MHSPCSHHVWQVLADLMLLDVGWEVLKHEIRPVVSLCMLKSQRKVTLVCSQGEVDDAIQQI